MLLTETPVKNLEELQQIISQTSDAHLFYEVAVEALIFSSDGKLLLHKRWQWCRDEVGKLEGIGGRYEKEDETFLNAVKREIREELGDKAQITIKSFFWVKKDTVWDIKNNQEKHWVIISYLCDYIGGELLIMEPRKNEGFHFIDIHTVDETLLNSSTMSVLPLLRARKPLVV